MEKCQPNRGRCTRSGCFHKHPPQLIGSASKIALQNSGTQSWQLTASGNPTSFSASGLPAGWSLNATSGLLSGPTGQAGTWLIPVTATNAYGMGSAILQLDIIATGGAITHEIWNNISPTATTSSFDWSSNATQFQHFTHCGNSFVSTSK